MDKVQAFASRRSNQVLTAIAVVGSVLLYGAAAGADVVSSAFTSEQSTLLGYIGDGALFVVALMALGLGIRLLIKWSKRGVSAS